MRPRKPIKRAKKKRKTYPLIMPPTGTLIEILTREYNELYPRLGHHKAMEEMRRLRGGVLPAEFVKGIEEKRAIRRRRHYGWKRKKRERERQRRREKGA